MANSSSTVSTTDVITAAQYNNLRTDAIGPYGDDRNFPDNIKTTYGTGATDGEIYSDGSSWIFDAIGGFDIDFKVSGITILSVTSSGFALAGNQLFDDNEKIIMGTGSDAEIFYDGTDLIINPDAVGSGVLKVGSTVEIEAGANLRFGAVTVLVDNPAGTMTLSNVDALDATTEATIEAAIDTLANLTAAAALVTVGTITTGVWSATDVAVAAGGTGASTASVARTNLGVAIGSDVQAWDADLDTWAGKTAPSGTVVGTTDIQTLTNKTITAAGNTISGLAHGSEVDNPTSGVHGAVGTIVGTSDAQTLTNKTIAMVSNTVSGTAALFNTALTDDTFAFISDTLAVFAATTSLQLLGVISDETGTGSLVFGTAPTVASPTITTSPSATGSTWDNLGTVTTVDINGGTIDGVTIGGASAGAGTFTSGLITGNLTLGDGSIVDSSGAISFGNENLVTTGTFGAGATTVAALIATTGTFSGAVSVDDTTASTSGTTGSIHTDGGLGVVLDVAITGHIGVGGSAPSATRLITGSESFSSSSSTSRFGILMEPNVSITAGTMTGENTGYHTEPRVGASNSINWTSTVGLKGYDNRLILLTGNSATVTGAAGYHMQNALVQAGTLTNLYGMFFEDLTAATNNWAIFNSGSADNNFGSGTSFIGDTANANMTVGLTINQGANDDNIIELKSSDVSHGFTSFIETDSFFRIKKASATLGGVTMGSFSEDAAVPSPFDFFSGGGTPDTAKTTAGVGLFNFWAYQHDGANNATNIDADGNVFSIRARVGGSLLTRFLVDEDGDMYSVTTGQTFDDFDDMAILDTLDGVRSGTLKGHIKAEFGKTMYMNEQTMIDMGILGDTMANGGLTNQTQLARVHTGAIRQQNQKHMSLVEEVDSLKSQLKALTEAK